MSEKYWKKWKLAKPYAMTLEGFDEWDKENKTKYPVRFFLQETLYGFVDIWFHRIIIVPYEKVRWGITYRLFKKHQYHIIRPRTLKHGFYDEDTRILHAVMECFASHYENNMDDLDYEYPPKDELSKVNMEIFEIYDWWMFKYPEREITTVDGKPLAELPELPDEWGCMAMLRREYDEEPLMKEWVIIAKEHSENKADWYNKENEILKRIIEIRKNLWD